MTRKSLALAAAFVALAAVALAGLAYVSTVALRLEAERAATAREAALEENVRLSLWRLDSYLSTMIALENALPAGAFDGGAPAPKPAAVRERFIAGRPPAGAAPGHTDPSEQELLAALDHSRQTKFFRSSLAAPEQGQRRYDEDHLYQSARNTEEFNNRAQQNAVTNSDVQSFAASNLPLSQAARIDAGMLRPVWVGDELYLARSTADGVQTVWLDWPVLRNDLTARIADLLPAARLEPFTRGEAAPGRLLSALPVTIVPGTPPAPASGRSPVTVALSFAWVAAAAALLAIAALLAASITLAERRSAFVSAVTHELRTPLTTLKLYTEMLSAGMVSDDGQRVHYLETLRLEADRLGHLVENVLAYSRLEGRRGKAELSELSLAGFFERSLDRLSELAARSGLRLELSDPDGLSALTVQADPPALERVLVNLVDNAGKYAGGAADPVLRIELARDDGRLLIRLRDSGPGISPAVRRRLFRPFSKSAADAAVTAPGVGLGLALSRRLLRNMNGDLVLESGNQPGATFVLRIRLAGAADGTPGRPING